MIISLDTETHKITETDPLPPLVCASYAVDGAPPDLVRHEDIAATVEAIIDTGADLVLHNAPYDLANIAKRHPHLMPRIFDLYDRGKVRDTLVREALEHIERGTLQEESERNKGLLQLGTLARDHLGVALDKGDDSWRLRYAELADVPLSDWPLEARNYATADAASTLEIFKRQKDKPDETLQTRAHFALQLMSAHGAITDPEAVDRFELDLLERAVQYTGDLRECGLLRPDGSRDTKLTRRLVESAYLNPPRTDPSDRFPDGQVKYDALTLEESGDPRLQKLAAYGAVSKLLDTYVPLMRAGHDHPIHGSYNVLVASGRTSAFKPNWQNLPTEPGARECIRARPGKVLVSCDLSLAELRALAQVTYSMFGHSAMRDALIAGRELHLQLACAILGINYDRGAALKSAKDPEVIAARQLAKSMNFGLAGGLGATTFSEYLRGNGIHKSVEDCAALKDQWLMTWPEMREYFDLAGRECGDFGPKKITQWGSGRVRGGLRFTQWCNGWFQGLVADIAKAWMWRVTRACYLETTSPLYGARPEFMIHDELIVECDEAGGHEVACELERLALEVANEWHPDVPAAADAHLMRHWTKTAEAVHDKHGRLVCWEDRDVS